MVLPKTKFIWFNGKLVEWDKAQVHVLVHALHYGSAVFEGIRCYRTATGTVVFRLKDHMQRLQDSAKYYGMQLPFFVDDLVQATKKLVKENKLKEGYVRPIAFYGYGKMGLNPVGSPVDVAIACWPWGAYLGEEGKKRGIKCCVSTWRRIPPNSLPMAAKACGQYVNSIIASQEAAEKKCHEAILLNSQGLVAEGAGENLFLVKNGKIHTPGLSAGILGGITRDCVFKIARDLKIEVVERDIERRELYAADELFFSGTAAEVTPIREVDGVAIGTGSRGSVTEKIQKKYSEATLGNTKKYRKWLTFV
ncbi:MAG: branched-chain amino acid transaminase [Candidatus Micrarchaeia archaeon]